MKFQKMNEITEKITANEYLNDLNNRIYEGFNSVDMFKDDKVINYDVTEEETIFALPDNYSPSKSIVDVYVNDIEEENYSIEERNFINCIVLTTAVSNTTIQLRCRNIKQGFLNFINNNLAMG